MGSERRLPHLSCPMFNAARDLPRTNSQKKERKIPGAIPGTRGSKAKKQGTHRIDHGPELVDSNSCRIVRPNTLLQFAPGI